MECNQKSMVTLSVLGNAWLEVLMTVKLKMHKPLLFSGEHSLHDQL